MHHLRVMTYNIHHGAGNDDCVTSINNPGEPARPDRGLNLERTAEVIRAESLDVVCLQEVDRFWSRSAYGDQPAQLSEQLGMHVAFGVNVVNGPDQHSTRQNQYGVATLSRHPILHHENFLLPNEPGSEQRGILVTHLQIPDIGEIIVLNTHLQVSEEKNDAKSLRSRQIKVLKNLIASYRQPVIVMGDFNTDAADGELVELIGEGGPLTDAWLSKGEGSGRTYFQPGMPPESRIDYVMISDAFQVRSCEVRDNSVTRLASDHLPVVVELGYHG